MQNTLKNKDSSRFYTYGVLSAALAASMVLTGCNFSGGRTVIRPAATGPIAPPPPPVFSPIEGNWMHSEGLFNATFREGRFESISPQTGSRLAAGSYGVIGDNQISLSFKTARGTQESAVCQLVGGTSLTCAPTNGSSFSMTRA